MSEEQQKPVYSVYISENFYPTAEKLTFADVMRVAGEYASAGKSVRVINTNRCDCDWDGLTDEEREAVEDLANA